MEKELSLKEYYQQRFYWIFHYTSKNFWYCLAKTLCIVVGLPIYCVMFVVEMVLTAVNMLFCWIPILNVVVTVICKALITAVGATFYICILTDISAYKKATSGGPEYELVDVDAPNQAAPAEDAQSAVSENPNE